MTASAKVRYNATHLREELQIEGAAYGQVRTHVTSAGVTITVGIEDDELLDNLVTSLTAEQKRRRIQRAEVEVRRLTRERDQATLRRDEYHTEWRTANEKTFEVTSKLTAAERELAALTAKETL